MKSFTLRLGGGAITPRLQYDEEEMGGLDDAMDDPDLMGDLDVSEFAVREELAAQSCQLLMTGMSA